ncbi:MAG: DUF512 domain-containing protein [Candidatus Zhuqueibacterota bacterium]
MKIIDFEIDSLAEDAGLLIDDDVLKINGFPCRDIIDYQFHSAEEELEIEIVRQGEPWIFEIEKDFDDPLGIIFEETRYRSCGNSCIFCFVDQNPPDLRPALYFKDEDFRLSFLYGNYVTMTNVSKKDLARIVGQRLSPLYISVHSTDLATRKLMLGLKNDDRLLDKIQFLVENHIEIHAQIVLCPGINDGDLLTKTIHDLAAFHPNLRTIAIVPLGLTRHRDGLYPLRPVTESYSAALIHAIEPIANSFKTKCDDYIVYLADEFYLKANIELPGAERYEDFAQIENGVGMTRAFIDRVKEQIPLFPHRITRPLSMVLVSALSATPVIKQWVEPALARIGGLSISVATITNEFYGPSVTVTGLLSGQDIFKQLSLVPPRDIIVLPANCLNFDGLFLDDWTVSDLEHKLNSKVEIVADDFLELLEKIG